MDIKPRIYYSKITQQWHWYWWYSKLNRIATPSEVKQSKNNFTPWISTHAYNFIRKLNSKQERLV